MVNCHLSLLSSGECIHRDGSFDTPDGYLTFGMKLKTLVVADGVANSLGNGNGGRLSLATKPRRDVHRCTE
jgi:hypothetical protein